ncbi:replication initiation factor domain-containing protein (plasmid) [Lactobacillus johnsonii]
MAKLVGKSDFIAGPNVPIRFKIDWFAFTVPETLDKKKNEDFFLLKKLGYDLNLFDEVAGKNFFNAGYSLGGGYVKVYYNDPAKPKQKGASNVHNYIFTGVGASDLYEKIGGGWVNLFRYLKEFGVSFRRLDIALDDLSYPPRIGFDFVERKLARKEFRSSKRRYNILNDRKTNGKPVGKTVYFGSRKTTGSNGRTLLRVYQKAFEMVYAKKQESSLPPEVVLQSSLPNFDGNYSWNRWELEITKSKAIAMIDLILELSESVQNPISEAYYSVLRDTIDFLVPTKDKSGRVYKNKAKWKTSPKYLDFLRNAKSAKLEDPDKLYDLSTVMNWIKYSVTPSLQMCDEVFSERLGIDFFDLLREFVNQNPSEYSKKQERLLLESSFMSDDELRLFVKHFLERKGSLNV